MKTINLKNILSAVAAACVFAASSCEVDNYPGPDAQIYGSVIDAETGEKVEQDVNSGSLIRYIELGYDNPVEQTMIFKTNGDYRNNLMFSGDYDFFFYESNFTFPEGRISNFKVKKGENKFDFKVVPYIRFSDVSIKVEDTKVVANFKITPAVDADVLEVGLYGHLDYIVGDRYKRGSKVVGVNESFNGQTREYTLELDLTNFTEADQYWFRVGAKANMPNSKHNYAPAVRLKIK